MQKIICGRAGLVLALAFALGLSVASATEPGSSDTYSGKGLLVVDVRFAADGTVAACRIEHSNVPYVLEKGTVDYIRRKWVNELFAGNIMRLPITFDALPWYAKHWDEGMMPPPNFLPAGDPGRTLKLRVTFGTDGWLKGVQLLQPSGLDEVDRDTAVWVKIHWHDDAYKGQTLDAPFILKTPITPAPVMVKAAPKPKTVAPVEPAAPPAVRVE